MRSFQFRGLGTLLGPALLFPGLALLLPACSSGGGGSTGPMFVESCSLGCSNGQGGNLVSCSVVNVGRNVEITVLFSERVQLSSVNSGSFRIINTTNGSVPVGTYSLDPVNDRRLIFRPALTFDAVGNPLFALDNNETYQVTVPGEAQGDNGPFVQSVGGRVNQSRLQCTIRTTEGVLDPVPGPPVQHTTIEVRKLVTGEVLEVFDPANGATGVPTSGPSSGQQTVIRVVFNDIMNPATLANLSTGQSSTITVKIDPDGNLVDSTDQVEQAGFFTVVVDFDNLRTVLEFFPSGGFPSGGRDDDPNLPGNQEVKRLIVMNLPPNLLDLVGNQLSNPQQIVFRTEVIAFPAITLPQPDPTIEGDVAGEGFQNQNNADVARSGARWEDGRLTYGSGGASGRLGDLVVGTGQQLTLDTDSQDFPIPGQVRSFLDNSIPGVDYDPQNPSTWPNVTVEDGAFEFARILVSSTGRLILTGSNAPRLFARGRLVVNAGATIDIAGGSAPAHIGNTGREADNGQASAFGGPGGQGGPAAGSGGAGANRIDQSDSCQPTTMINIGGINLPSQPGNPGTDNDGRQGEGVGLTPFGGGQGGMRWPPSPPRRINPISPDPTNCNGQAEFIPFDPPDPEVDLDCRVAMASGPGSGGGYALTGGEGIPVSPFENDPTIPPSQPGNLALTPGPTPGGDTSGLGLEPPDQPAAVRRLDFHEGNLRGGSGGGGGGGSIYATKTNSANPNACFASSGNINPFWDHSAAGGGAGGGAVQMTAGAQAVLSGIVDASGGDGGSGTGLNVSIFSCTNAQSAADCEKFASPGGGGSGGAVRIQASTLELTQLPSRVSVEGGQGGIGGTGSIGGAGSPGLVRIELPGVDESDASQISQLAQIFAPSIAPYMPNAGTEPGGFNYPFLSGAMLSIGRWEFQRLRPDSMSASMSCWMKPEGNFFELDFVADDETDPDNPDAKGWNMDVLFAAASGEKSFPYRGLSADPEFPLTGTDFESFLGQMINSELPPGQGSLIAVRFQGARASGSLNDPCNVQLAGLGSEIESGSLTTWVRHPAELNLFSPQPNMVRFCVVFEETLKTQGPVQFRVRGITNLKVFVQPN